MDMSQLVILDPVSKPVLSSIPNNPRLKTVVGATIGMLDNTKPNFDIFCDKVEELLLKNYGVAKVIRYRKPGRTIPADQSILDDIKKNCDLVLTGLGD